jgi:dTDP-4-dehydrorhamnose 3,5-epimerase-like enzyme
MNVKIDTLRVAKDGRGYVFEPLEVAGLAGTYRNVHVVYTLPGVVRGNHYHQVGTEITSVSGPTLVRYKQDGVVHDVRVPAGEVWRFEFPAGVSHAFKNEGDYPSVLAAFNTEAHDPAKPDAVRDVLIE